MAITLWGRLNSSNVQKVVWTLRELELPFEHVQLGGSFGGTDSPDYRAMNPNGLVPTLQDGDLTIWESHASSGTWPPSMAVACYIPSSPGAAPSWTSGPTGRPPRSSRPG